MYVWMLSVGCLIKLCMDVWVKQDDDSSGAGAGGESSSSTGGDQQEEKEKGGEGGGSDDGGEEGGEDGAEFEVASTLLQMGQPEDETRATPAPSPAVAI